MSNRVIATNRKAYHEYHILEKFEGGIILSGSEVKALRENKANIKESYIRFFKSELYIIGMHIGAYSHSGYSTHVFVHDRKLLLHKYELKKNGDNYLVSISSLNCDNLSSIINHMNIIYSHCIYNYNSTIRIISKWG